MPNYFINNIFPFLLYADLSAYCADFERVKWWVRLILICSQPTYLDKSVRVNAMGIVPNLNRIPFNATKNSQQHWTNRSWHYENTPTFFPDPYSAGMHEELHRAIKNDTEKNQGPWQGSADVPFNVTSRNLYSISHITNDLRIPSTAGILVKMSLLKKHIGNCLRCS